MESCDNLFFKLFQKLINYLFVLEMVNTIVNFMLLLMI